MAILISLIIPVICAIVAHNKGYNPIAWFFGGGVLSSIFLWRLPNLRTANLNETERATHAKNGMTIPLVFAGLSILIQAGLLMLGST